MAGKRILVAVDGSAHGNRAVDLAAELSAKLGHDLDIVHVLMHGRPSQELQRMAEVEHMISVAAPTMGLSAAMVPGDFGRLMAAAEEETRAHQVIRDIGEEIVRRAAERAKKAGATGIETHLEVGDDADEILDRADAEGVRMIVLGSRGLGRVRGLVLGSVSQKVLLHAPCTVVTVR
ncbi:universal stress protein [Aquicoccus sp. SCR17]|nr:universal stress protein [Carideicomes alvinocaridis]